MLEGFDDEAAVHAALEEVQSGAVPLNVDDSTTAADTICTVDTKLEMVAPETSTLDDNAGKGGDSDGKGPSKLASIVIGVVVAAVGLLLVLIIAVFVVRRRRAANGNPSAVHPSRKCRVVLKGGRQSDLIIYLDDWSTDWFVC